MKKKNIDEKSFDSVPFKSTFVYFFLGKSETGLNLCCNVTDSTQCYASLSATLLIKT